MKLKKCRTCGGCAAYEDGDICKKGACSLGFNVTQIGQADDGSKMHTGTFRFGWIWPVWCKPAEPCYKPKTAKQYADAYAERFLNKTTP